MDTTVQPSIRTSIRSYLTEELISFDEHVSDDAPLEDHDLDSEQIVALVLFLEEQFHIQVKDEEITVSNFGSVQALVAFVSSKTDRN
jgi:acyl carrier protein